MQGAAQRSSMGYQTTWTYYASSFEVPVPSFGRIVGYTEAILRESTSALPVIRELSSGHVYEPRRPVKTWILS